MKNKNTLLLLLLTTLIFLHPTPSVAQPLSEFLQIYSPDPAMYDMYQMKFTYLGPQKKIVLSLGIVGTGRMFDAMAFAPWQVDYNYANDEIMGDVLVVPGQQWQFFMDTLQNDPQLQSTARIADPNCSLMIYTDNMGPPMCWEHPATRVETDMLFQLFQDSVMDPAQKEVIARFRRQMAGVRQ